jgi:hypothetical protein
MTPPREAPAASRASWDPPDAPPRGEARRLFVALLDGWRRGALGEPDDRFDPFDPFDPAEVEQEYDRRLEAFDLALAAALVGAWAGGTRDAEDAPLTPPARDRP